MEQYRISPRANFLDYNSGDYFVTICTDKKVHYFGEIINGEIYLSDIGQFVDNQLRLATEFCDYIEIPLYVVMPNHIHIIVCVSDRSQSGGVISQRAPNPAFRADVYSQRQVPVLSRYVNSLKGAVTKFAKSKMIEFRWQPRYHDHCIRNQREANFISEYIQTNVARWHNDCFNTVNP